MTAADGHVTVSLPDGTPLITGGEGWGPIGNGPCCSFLGSLASAELYNSLTGNFTATGNMTARRELHTATALNDGRVLITGGFYYGGISLFYGSVASAEIYTPSLLVPAPALFSILVMEASMSSGWCNHGIRFADAVSATAGDVLAMYTTSLIQGGVIPPRVVFAELLPILYSGASKTLELSPRLTTHRPGRSALLVPMRASTPPMISRRRPRFFPTEEFCLPRNLCTPRTTVANFMILRPTLSVSQAR